MCDKILSAAKIRIFHIISKLFEGKVESSQINGHRWTQMDIAGHSWTVPNIFFVTLQRTIRQNENKS